ncbi:putative ketopantoate reductase PanE/ApbA C terminal [Lyophyllum shimeji]|uniref:Ketopantoate reductase PanE/ApbA C terminal n=1 Tax=Lyophyllum shimeji TaxID=47721 RepID=A0A9P3PR64_LYOSH|nr:putative ketopantoate reductase PanE/ApbA C terminal [Lyophyllum shimeji]
MATPTDVLLVGFGAVGAVYSLVLKRSGLARVTAVARGNYDAVSSRGVHFKSAKYGEIEGWRPDRLVRSVAEAADRRYSYVFVTTKAIPERVRTPQILHPLLSSPYADEHPQPTYVLLQNGLNVEVDLYNALKKLGKGEPKIVSTALWIGTNLLEPHIVEHGNFDRLSIGMYRYNDFTTEVNSPKEAAILEDLGEMLSAGGSEITIVPEVQRTKFAKNFWNVAFSSFSTLTQQRLPALWRPPPSDPSISYTPYVCQTTAELITKYTLPNIKAVMEELVVLARAIGYPDSASGVPSTLPDTVMENARGFHIVPESFHKPSMQLDAEKGLPIEVEVIFGEVVRMARERGVDMPRVEMLYALLLVIQNQILAKLEA